MQATPIAGKMTTHFFHMSLKGSIEGKLMTGHDQ
jgi:hypothetical protein